MDDAAYDWFQYRACAQDVILTRLLLEAGHSLAPIIIHKADANTAEFVEKPAVSDASAEGRILEYFGLSFLHLMASYLERTITEKLLVVKAEMQRPKLDGKWRDGSEFDSFSFSGLFHCRN